MAGSDEMLQFFLRQATTQGARSTALNPILIIEGTLLSALVVCANWGAPQWLIEALFVLVVIILFVFVGAYIFFMLKDPDALRSEKFTLSKMAIERSRIGDSSAGFVDPEQQLISLPTVEPQLEDE
jgi:hypothetical protein